jgi:hypothetical protein
MTHLVWWMMSEEVIKPVKVDVLTSVYLFLQFLGNDLQLFRYE